MCIYPLLAPVKVAVIPSKPSEHKLCMVGDCQGCSLVLINNLVDLQFGQYFAEELRQHRMKTVFCDDINKSLSENYIEYVLWLRVYFGILQCKQGHCTFFYHRVLTKLLFIAGQMKLVYPTVL